MRVLLTAVTPLASIALAALAAPLLRGYDEAAIHLHLAFAKRVLNRVSELSVIALAASILLGSVGHAADVRGLTLEEAINIAYQENKDLQAARYVVDRAQARLVQAGLYPNPRLDISTRSDFLFRNEGEYAASAALVQQFPIAGRIARQQDVAQVDIDLAAAEISQAERGLAREVAASFYRLAVLNRRIQELTGLVDVNKKLLETTRNRFKAAEVSELDITTVQVELQRLAQERSLLETERLAEQGRLNQLLGRTAARPLALDETLPELKALPSVAEQQQQALAMRPDLRAELLGADRARAELALGRAERWEDWTIGLGIEQDRLSIMGAPSQDSDRALGVTLSIPLPLFNRNQGRITEAVVAGIQAAERIDALKAGIKNAVFNAHVETERLRTALQEYQDSLFPVSRRNVHLAQQAYNQGQTSIFAVVQAQRQHSDLHIAYLNVLDQYLQVLAGLRYGLIGNPAGTATMPAPQALGTPSAQPASGIPSDSVRPAALPDQPTSLRAPSEPASLTRPAD